MLLTRWVARHATEVENVAPRVGLGGRGHVCSAGMGGWFFSWANVGCFGWFLVARHAIEAENVAPRAGLGGGTCPQRGVGVRFLSQANVGCFWPVLGQI